jgi:S-adenosylmethionine decarboxylase proenzyme
LGRHVLAEFYDCNSNVLNNPALIEQVMSEAAVACGATVVQTCFHRFNPFGVSGVVVISESHLAIHTWPEYGYASVDLYTCGDKCDPLVACEYMREKLGAGDVRYCELTRGMFDPENRRMLPSQPMMLERPTRQPVAAAAATTVTQSALLDDVGGA